METQLASGEGDAQQHGMGAGEEGVQYNTARTLRHLALGSQPAHKKAALPAVVPLTQALQVNHPCPYHPVQLCSCPHHNSLKVLCACCCECR